MIRVYIIAPTPAMRAGLRVLVSGEGLEVAGEAALLGAPGFDDQRYDVIVASDEGVLADAARVLSPEDPPAVVVLSGRPGTVTLLRQLPLRGWGLVLPDAPASELQAAIQATAQGLIVLPAALAGRLLDARPEAEPLPEPLTVREHEVLALLSQGLPNRQIARALQISEHTVKFHVSAIYAKLGASNRAEAVNLGARHGLITL